MDEVVRQSQINDGVGMELVNNCDLVRRKADVLGTGNCGNKKNKAWEFKDPVVDDSINDFSCKKFAPEPRHKIKWAVNLYGEWRRNQIGTPGCDFQIVQANLEMLYTFCKADLCYSLSRFVRKVRRIDGKEYLPNTIHELVVMVQMYLQENSINWKLLDDPEFSALRNVVDNTMKQKHSEGLGVRKSAEIISLDQENVLFEKGVLGQDSPLQLLCMVIYMLGMHCALCGGIEHNNLRRPGCNPQIIVEKYDNVNERLVYTEDPLQKMNQGGLVSRGRGKKVMVYPASNKNRCPVYLYKKYIGLLSNSLKCKKLYLRVKKNPLPSVWYCDQPYRFNKIKTVVKDMCKEGGIEGRFTNHSLRATCATRMYEKQVPEQVIKEVTGHRSEYVRSCKRTSESIKEMASHTVSDSTEVKASTSKGIGIASDKDCYEMKSKCKHVFTMEQMIENVEKTKREMLRKKFPKSRLKLKRSKSGWKVTIDVNVNISKLGKR